jgi:hypothetical protein
MTARQAEFVAAWLRANLPPFYATASVVALAARLREDAARSGVDLDGLGGSAAPTLELLILQAMNARLSRC